MLLPKTQRQPRTYSLDQLGRRQVVADFTGGQITADAGLPLITLSNTSNSRHSNSGSFTTRVLPPVPNTATCPAFPMGWVYIASKE